MVGDILGVPRDVKKAQERADKAGLVISAFAMNHWGQVAAIDPSEIMISMLNYMRKSSDLAWSLDGNLAVAGMSDQAMLVIVLPDSERLTLAEETRRGGTWSPRHERLYQWLQKAHVLVVKKDEAGRWQSGTLGSFRGLEEAQAKANAAAETLSLHELSNRKKGWRKDPATPKQVRYLRTLGVDVPEGCGKGLAAQLITGVLAKRAAAEWMARERKVIWYQPEPTVAKPAKLGRTTKAEREQMEMEEARDE